MLHKRLVILLRMKTIWKSNWKRSSKDKGYRTFSSTRIKCISNAMTCFPLLKSTKDIGWLHDASLPPLKTHESSVNPHTILILIFIVFSKLHLDLQSGLLLSCFMAICVCKAYVSYACHTPCSSIPLWPVINEIWIQLDAHVICCHTIEILTRATCVIQSFGTGPPIS